MTEDTKAAKRKSLKAEQARIKKELQDLDTPNVETSPNGELKPPSTIVPAASSRLDDRESDFQITKETRYVVFQPNHNLMGKPDLREQDRRPQRMFFYRRLTDDKTLCFTEAEAALMMQGSHAPILRQIGVSDGTTYWKYLRNCGVKSGERITVEKSQEILNAAQAAELEVARGHYDRPMPQNVHFDDTIRRHNNANAIISGFSPSN